MLLACRNQDQPGAAASLTATPDSGRLAAYEDSILDGLHTGGQPAVLPNGDTVFTYGGGMMEAEGAQDYGIDHYRIGATHYVRIQRAIGRKANGNPIWLTRARLRLPPMDSTEDIVTEGLCAVNGKNDRFVLGIAGTAGDSVRWQARHAWRFDLATESLQEISTTGVSCGHAGL